MARTSLLGSARRGPVWVAGPYGAVLFAVFISRHGRRDPLEDVRGDRLESWRGPRGTVRAGEGPGLAAKHEPVRSGAAGTDTGIPGEARRPRGTSLAGLGAVANPAYWQPKLSATAPPAVNVAPLARYSA